jgi:hypothetical protein
VMDCVCNMRALWAHRLPWWATPENLFIGSHAGTSEVCRCLPGFKEE